MDPSILFLGMLLVLILLMFQRSSRQRRETAQVQAGLLPGAEVMTASGLFATVIDVDEQKVTLQTGPGQTSTWDRRAVARIITPAVTDDNEPGSTETEPGTGGGAVTDS